MFKVHNFRNNASSSLLNAWCDRPDNNQIVKASTLSSFSNFLLECICRKTFLIFIWRKRLLHNFYLSQQGVTRTRTCKKGLHICRGRPHHSLALPCNIKHFFCKTADFYICVQSCGLGLFSLMQRDNSKSSISP